MNIEHNETTQKDKRHALYYYIIIVWQKQKTKKEHTLQNIEMKGSNYVLSLMYTLL